MNAEATSIERCGLNIKCNVYQLTFDRSIGSRIMIIQKYRQHNDVVLLFESLDHARRALDIFEVCS